jgi:hypothetical protein
MNISDMLFLITYFLLINCMKHSKKFFAFVFGLLAIVGLLSSGTHSSNSSAVLGGFFAPADTGKVVKDAQITVNEEDRISAR